MVTAAAKTKMKRKSRQYGLTLTEMTVVVAGIALLAAFGLPAVRALLNSFQSPASTRVMISAVMASARAIAAKEQHYAGIRFQKAYNPDDPLNPLNATQYMVFIVHDVEGTGLASGFRAVEGLKPIKLPDSVGVTDLYTRGVRVVDNSGIDEQDELNDTTTFCVVFSPAGKLVIHEVRVVSRSPDDPIFNDVPTSGAMFQQDDDTFPYWQESSRNGFIIYDRQRFKPAYEQGQAYSGYLVRLLPEAIYINPYAGTIINR